MRIGETAAAAGLTAKTLRFYEDRGLLPAADRAPNGYRDYPHETVSRLEFIRRGRTAGLTLAQISDILTVRDLGQAPCVHVKDLLASQLRHLDAQIAELTALRATVAEFHDAAAAGNPASCDPERICSYL
ncbi:heavy metal-responsive transcriptional regulator [Pseudarthrobacter sp. NIBRBAC000502770]|uniref:heavy metal-responsive transcriptional regulator n=1 Tax=Pseudarthrobacter sp. NIBRBAC000502770 TaxID=2590785 RepID=UPI00113FC794|nr:heavy metal-responsive transcriptional regulator [Pseudarthrobacter sp. NIBRBAC000502770]QDG87118.1 heavy metal-responsive transcriptional regulator [Pseudarthrobacter sp. NIBRBAC000502770]